MNNEIVLKVNNKEYKDWKEVTVKKSITSLCGSFVFNAINKNPESIKKWDIHLGETCTVEVNKKVIITGYIEDLPMTYDHKEHTILVSGRDNTCDLVDCSFMGSSKEWKGQSIKSIITKLCDYFNIKVHIDENVSSLGEHLISSANALLTIFSVNEGDTAFEAIKKVCFTKALLPVSYGDGNLTITRAGSNRCLDQLVLGKNILSAEINQSNRDRFSRYIVKGNGGEDFQLLDDYRSKREAIDQVVALSRKRPLVMLYEGGSSNQKCLDRAIWEARSRAAKSRTITYTVQGFSQVDGTVWPLNSLVTIDDSYFGISKEDMLISDIEYIYSKYYGTTTKLTITNKEAYVLLETPIKTLKFNFELRKKDVNVPDSVIAVGGE